MEPLRHGVDRSLAESTACATATACLRRVDGPAPMPAPQPQGVSGWPACSAQSAGPKEGLANWFWCQCG